MEDYKDALTGVFRETAEEFLGFINLDYTKECLGALEDFINSIFPDEGRPKHATTIVPMGYVLGETLIRNFPNAEWITQAENVFDIEIKIWIKEEEGKYIKAKPFLRVLKFFEDRTDSICAMYDLVESQVQGTIDFSGKNKIGEWEQKGNLKYRVIGEGKIDNDNKS